MKTNAEAIEILKANYPDACFEQLRYAVDIAIKALEEPQRKKGHWILVKGSNGKDYYKCSECLHTQEITGVKNYCAVCGADMRELEDIPMEYFESGGR